MPLWLDLLRTPMAAPETAKLRSMRRTFQLLCIACAMCVTLVSPLTTLLGRTAPVGIAGLLVTTAIYTGLYVFRKNRADEAFLAAATLDKQP
jgi:uncharacterized membrane protein (DUF485 family)